MPGARSTRSLVRKMKKHTSVVTTVTPETPGIPRAMVLTVSFVLFPVIGLCCHRRLQSCLCKLERQRRGVRTTRLRRPLQALSSGAPSASTASRLTSVTIAKRPSERGGTGESISMFLPGRQVNF